MENGFISSLTIHRWRSRPRWRFKLSTSPYGILKSCCVGMTGVCRGLSSASVVDGKQMSVIVCQCWLSNLFVAVVLSRPLRWASFPGLKQIKVKDIQSRVWILSDQTIDTQWECHAFYHFLDSFNRSVICSFENKKVSNVFFPSSWGNELRGLGVQRGSLVCDAATHLWRRCWARSPFPSNLAVCTRVHLARPFHRTDLREANLMFLRCKSKTIS
jgi:hypothetical protein